MPDVLGFEFYVDAFKELQTCRPPSFGGVAAIPFTAIHEYSKIYEVEDFHEFLYFIRVMDNALLEYENAKDKEKSASKPKARKK